MRVSKGLIGKEVLNYDVTLAGKVIDVDINLENRELSLIVANKGIQESLNIKKGELVIPWDLIARIGERIILKESYDSEEGYFTNVVKDESEDEDLDFEKLEDEINELKSRLY